MSSAVRLRKLSAARAMTRSPTPRRAIRRRSTRPKNLATAEGQSKAAFGESELGLGYDASPILGPIGPEPISQSMTTVGYRLGDAGPLTGSAGSLRLHDVIAHTGHTVFATTGEAGSADSDEVVKTARHVAHRFGPHVKNFIVA